MYLTSSTATVSGTTFSSCGATNTADDIYVTSSTLTCMAGCSEAGTYPSNGDCADPVAADMNSGTCYSNCPYSSSLDCSVCPDNMYALSGSMVCSSCDANRYIVSDNASDHASADQCTACGTGTYLVGATCTACEPGRYTTVTGQTTCDICDIGKFAATSGSVQCDSW